MPRTERSCAIATRWSSASDAAALARIHADAWRFAYRGIIPGVTLERMIARRSPDWWRRLHSAGGRVLALDVGGETVGYAQIGPARRRAFARMGEIRELYLDPTHHGVGLGRALFEAARRTLAAADCRGLVVWTLDDNAIGRRFYEGLGGRLAARGEIALDGVALRRVAFVWR